MIWLSLLALGIATGMGILGMRQCVPRRVCQVDKFISLFHVKYIL